MQEIMLNSLQIYERLRHARVDTRAAREIASVFGDLMDHQIAGKRDLAETETRVKAEIKVEIHRAKSETLKWMILWVSGLLAAQPGMIMAAIRIVR